MLFLIKKAKVYSKGSVFNGKQVDLLIKNGVIEKIGKNLKAPEAKIISSKALCISPGWLDIGTHTGEPGYEHRDDLRSISAAASAGGYTSIACFPNTNPTAHSMSEIHYIKSASQNLITDFHPIGAATKNTEGKVLTEMHDMHKAGAIGFSDGMHAIQDSGMMKRSLLYAKSTGSPIINMPFDQGIAGNGQVNEGAVSTSLGLKGIPNVAEDNMLHRDLSLLEYTDSKMMVHLLSSGNSVARIKEKKKLGLSLFTSVSSLNLFFTDDQLANFDSNLKVIPPIRTQLDRDALIRGLKDGTIDIIVSNHRALETEKKSLEFYNADFGATNLETCFASSRTALYKNLSVQKLVEKFYLHPRKALSIDPYVIQANIDANLTLFDSEEDWTFDPKGSKSKSVNSPFDGIELKGKVKAVFNNKKHRIFS